METPAFWMSKLSDIEALWESAQKASERRILTRSPGGRPVYMFAYGPKKEHKGTANWSSALGAHDAGCFRNPENKQKTVVLIGAEHGAETEGVAGLTNLITLLETGRELTGLTNDPLLESAEGVRLVIVPVANPDGRARVVPDAMVGVTGEELRYWDQGTWKDGSLCGWPECKKVHPIRGVSFLGGYFNDDGVNLMHDNFFHPMARETQALLDLCAEEQADIVLHLHGGSNSAGTLLETNYATAEVGEAISALSLRCYNAGQLEGLTFSRTGKSGVPSGKNPPSFNLVSAAHHVSGAVSVCYESNECIIDQKGPHLTHEQITRMHMILFEQAMRMVKGE